MLQSQNRLRRSDEILAVIKGGRVSKQDSFLVRFRKNNLQLARFGFVVSAREVKRATRRNLLKRRAREIVRKKMQNIKKGHDILFVFNKKAAALKSSELEAVMIYSLSAAGLL